MTDAPVSHLLNSPVELGQEIMSFLSKDDLLVLCRCCRALKKEGQRALFRDVKLRGRSQLASWAHAICSRPLLGTLVRALALPTRATLQPIDLLCLQQAMSLTSNLQVLRIKHCMTRHFRDSCLSYSMLMGSNPRLRVLESDLGEEEDSPCCQEPAEAVGFLQIYRDIEKLEISNRPGDTSSLVHAIERTQEAGHSVLENLKTLKLDTFYDLKSFNSSPLRCVTLNYVAMTRPSAEDLAFLLSPFGPTLENLTLKVHESGCLRGEQAPFAMPDFLDLLAEAIPRLRLLNISGDVVMHFAHEDNFLAYLSSLSKFLDLHTLVIDTANQFHRYSRWHSYLDAQFSCSKHQDECQCGLVCCAEACRRFAARFFNAIGSLRRVVLGSFAQDKLRSTWVGVGPASYVRQQQRQGLWDDEVVLEGFGIIRDDA